METSLQEAMERARRACEEMWAREAASAPPQPMKRWNVGFTATPDVAERINQYIRERAGGLVVRHYEIDEEGRPCR